MNINIFFLFFSCSITAPTMESTAQLLEDNYISKPMDTLDFNGYVLTYLMPYDKEYRGLFRGAFFLAEDSSVVADSSSIEVLEGYVLSNKPILLLFDFQFGILLKRSSKKMYYIRNWFPFGINKDSKSYKVISNGDAEFEIFREKSKLALILINTKLLYRYMPEVLEKFGYEKMKYILVAVRV